MTYITSFWLLICEYYTDNSGIYQKLVHNIDFIAERQRTALKVPTTESEHGVIIGTVAITTFAVVLGFILDLDALFLRQYITNLKGNLRHICSRETA